MRQWRTPAFAGVLVLAAIASFWAFVNGPSRSGETRHRDGEGPLAALDDPEGSQAFAADPAAGDVWTYGLALCLRDRGPATLDRVVPHATDGSGFEHLGTVVRRLHPPGESPIISVDGFPPSSPTTMFDVKGFVVDAPCEPRPPTAVNEVDIGLRQIGDDGGGWRGVDVHYVVDGRAYVLEAKADFTICGLSAPDCSVGPESMNP